MFENFTERARKVMSLARQETQSTNAEFIGTEHILLGILQDGGGVAAKVLKHMNVDLKGIHHEIEKLITPSTSPTVTLGQLPFSPRAKNAIKLAGEEAAQLASDTIGTEHLLLGLLKENEGIAAQVLINLGLKLDKTRAVVLDVLGAAEAKPSASFLAATTQPAAAADSALSSHDKAQMVVDAWLAKGGQETMPNHTGELIKMIAWAIEAARRGA